MDNQLPSFYVFKPGEEMTDHDLYDSLNTFIRRLDTMGDLLIAAGDPPANLAYKTPSVVGEMLTGMAQEAKALIDLWHEQNSKPRIVAGGES